MSGRKIEWRRSKHGFPMRRLAEAEGYSMVRHKGCAVHVIDTIEWDAMPICDANGVLPGGAAQSLCEDCPPHGYPTDKTRCTPCPRRRDHLANPTACVTKE